MSACFWENLDGKLGQATSIHPPDTIYSVGKSLRPHWKSLFFCVNMEIISKLEGLEIFKNKDVMVCKIKIKILHYF